MKGLPKAEILVRDEVHGRGSRSSDGAFDRPKAVGVVDSQIGGE